MKARYSEEQNDRDELAGAIRETPKLKRGTPRIDRLRHIVEHKQAARVEGLLMDLFTASMLVQIHDALNKTNRAEFLALPLRKMVSVGWKLVSP
jgi:hypothetical protein